MSCQYVLFRFSIEIRIYVYVYIYTQSSRKREECLTISFLLNNLEL